MDFNLTDEQRQLKDGAQRFLRERYDFESRRKLAASQGFSPDHWSRFAELGWLALVVPEDAGGLGLPFLDAALLSEELGRALVLEPFVGTALLCARLIERSGLPNREDILGGIAAGEQILALAHDEPQDRYSEGPGTTTAEKAGTQGWRITGLKTMAVGAAQAHRLIVSASLEGETALFTLPVDAAGVSIRPYALIDGTRAADVRFTDAHVAAGDLLARGAEAEAMLGEALDRARLALCAQSLGCIEAVMDITSDYLKTRQQFGQPIGRFQSLQHRMAEMFVESQEARSSLYRGIAAIDAAEPPLRQRAVSATCVAVAAAARFVCEQGIQLHGGIGLTDEYQVGHHYKRVLVASRLFGDADWHLDRYVDLSRRAA
jgi:alkylation response protein AidB-like acyl-CoA dehydrogenase